MPFSWHQLGTNVNYRITAILDVNGGASTTAAPPSSAGYSVPIDVLTLHDPLTNMTRQRMSYWSGMQVDYNTNGVGYRSIYAPYDYQHDRVNDDDVDDELIYHVGTGGRRGRKNGKGDAGGDDNHNDEDDDDDDGRRLCFDVDGGNDHPYLNFFPTIEQMNHYTLGKLVTEEPGIPYRVASLIAPHGSDDEIKPGHCLGPCPEPPSYNNSNRTGMPDVDWYRFTFEEIGNAIRPLEWTMLARNEIIDSHTERWVLRYLNYESINANSPNARLWAKWYDEEFRGEGNCGNAARERLGRRFPDDEYNGRDDDRRGMRSLGRLGMFFSHSSIPGGRITRSTEDGVVHNVPSLSSLRRFDAFLARNNRHYIPGSEEYNRRMSIHDANFKNLARWNEEHAGKTTFVQNEFMDMELGEVLYLRGGLRRPGRRRGGKNRMMGDMSEGGGQGKFIENDGGRRDGIVEHLGDNLRGSLSRGMDSVTAPAVGNLLDDDDDAGPDEEGWGRHVSIHRLPEDFDESTLPVSFDWRDYLPGSVGPVKDQGFCGSCWAFSLASSLESNWFVATGQAVDIPEQFIIDCSWDEDSSGCDGGNSDSAANTIVDRFHGLVPTRDVYGGYLSTDGKCYVETLRNLGMVDGKPDHLSSDPLSSIVQIDSWWYVPSRNDIAVKQALMTQGSLSITITVVPEMLYYSSGVLDVESCTKNDIDSGDHAITVVGWGLDRLPDGTLAEHWIVKNSWSVLWGDSGYMRVRMGARDCGISTNAGYPGIVLPKRDSSNSAHPLSEER